MIAADDNKLISIAPGEKKDVKVEAYCLNRELPPPDYAPGNVAIFELRNKGYFNQEQLWKYIDRAKKALAIDEKHSL